MNFLTAQDVTAVFDKDYAQVFRSARPIRLSARPSAKLMDHPLESGAVLSDHRVFIPNEIELLMILSPAEYRDAYRQVKAAFTSNDLLTVQTRVDSFQNMAIEQMPHDELPDMMDTVTLQIRMREVMLVTAQFEALPARAVSKPSDASTKKRGEQDAAPSKKSSKLNDLFGGAV